MSKRKHPDEPEDSSTNATNGTTSTTFSIPVEGKSPIPCERHGRNPDSTSPPDLIFTQGAGGGLNAPAMQDFAAGFTSPSTDHGQKSLLMFKGNLNLQSRVANFAHLVSQYPTESRIALGGRSMGARAACMTATSNIQTRPAAAALVLVSFPLLSQQSGASREQTLLDLPENLDVLFVSGAADAMCPLEALCDVMARMRARAWLLEVEGADHGMAIVGAQGASGAVRRRTGRVAARWLEGREEGRRAMVVRWDGEKGEVVDEGWQEMEGGEEMEEG